jgi:dTDP-4-dehydrorhamnose reductase
MYTEDDVSDAEDLYGRSKFLGEVSGPGCLTLRTSIIGRELNSTNGLVDWFLSNRGGHVQGYSQAIYSGFTTPVLARLMADIIEHHPTLTGLYQASAKPINKYELLQLLNKAFAAQVEVEPFPDLKIDRSLDSRRFRTATGFAPPSWSDMIQEMANDATPYAEWRNKRAI